MKNATAKVAFAAYLHDLGKFAERARLSVSDDQLQTHIQLYCPIKFHDNKPVGHTHKHAAYTALAWDLLEKHVPDLVHGDMFPFASRNQGENKTDSLLNASAMHHRPETFLQWVIATADRVASGFEREQFERYNQASDETPQEATGKNHYQTRLLTLFEQIGKDKALSRQDLSWCYPLKALSPDSIFPAKRSAIEPSENQTAQKQYADLWQDFQTALAAIPASHRQNWNLWLDHFDTLWQSYTQAIPSATAFGAKPEVSLYDHSKTTAALAAALWRWHHTHHQTDEQAALRLKNRDDWDEQKILLIQGDFFGIQNFIFASGSQTNKRAAKLLRGRSFQVSLFAELAALKILEACDLPPTSQVLNAAGKFMIVAPNTPDIHQALQQVRQEINDWFLQHTFGQVGLGLASQAASCNDFVYKTRFAELIKQSFAVLEHAKLQRFNLTQAAPTVLDADYSCGECAYNDKLPAQSLSDGINLADLSKDQIMLGSLLTKHDRLMIYRQRDSIYSSQHTKILTLPVFGLHVAFTEAQEISGKFGDAAATQSLLRCWDFSLPDNTAHSLWHGYARRYINAYVPHFTEGDEWLDGKYSILKDSDDVSEIKAGNPKTFNHIACEQRYLSENGQAFIGKIAIATLKGDVDNLGTIFQKGLQEPTFAKMASLSRQMNHFFSLWLPAYCAEHYPNTYTVFAGGDDFFMIGPWLQTQHLAVDMQQKFKQYVAENPNITFSAGISISKPGLPLAKLSAYAEEALEEAKAYHDTRGRLKNAVSIYGETVSWLDWHHISKAYKQIDELKNTYGLSTGYVYAMLEFCEMAGREREGDITASMWHSRFQYRTRRYVNLQKNIAKDARETAYRRLTQAFYQNGIQVLGSQYRIALFNHFYLLRAR